MGKKEFLEKYSAKRQKCEVWSRVMGYYRNVNNFNTGKQSEFNVREFFHVSSCPCGKLYYKNNADSNKNLHYFFIRM